MLALVLDAPVIGTGIAVGAIAVFIATGCTLALRIGVGAHIGAVLPLRTLAAAVGYRLCRRGSDEAAWRRRGRGGRRGRS